MSETIPAQSVPGELQSVPDGALLSVNTKRAAEILGISRSQLYNLIRAGEIASSKLPSTSGVPNIRLIRVSELQRFLDRHADGTPAA